VPYLKPASIGWCVIGKDPAPYLVDASVLDKNLRVFGYVEDLCEVLVDYPIMVNPMRSGSGMKNKVLEAHAMGLAVVSSTLGMESINGAMSGSTYMTADTPRQFFDAVQGLLDDACHRAEIQRAAQNLVLEKYTWKTIDAQWVNLVGQVFAPAGQSKSLT
jgi:glycosyltransferase involved in cell wall biosynthesis